MLTIEQYKQQLLGAMHEHGLPRTVWEGLTEYILIGRPTGDFLDAVLSNDLIWAVKKADDLNLPRLRDYVYFLEGCAPVNCFGSSAAVSEWKRIGGIMGRQRLLQASKSEPIGEVMTMCWQDLAQNNKPES